MNGHFVNASLDMTKLREERMHREIRLRHVLSGTCCGKAVEGTPRSEIA